MANIIEQLKIKRKEKELSQSDLGVKLGLPQSHISKIEKGKTDLRLSTVIDMARVMDQELVLVPRQLVPYIRSILDGEPEQERMWQSDDKDTEE